MNQMVMSVVVLLVICSDGHVMFADDPQGFRNERQSLDRVQLSNGSWIAVLIPIPENEGAKMLAVDVALYSRTTQHIKQPHVWVAQGVTSLEGPLKNRSHYVLLKETKEGVFLFFPWNAKYCILDVRSGQIVKNGEGDEPLLAFECLVPVKLIVLQPSTGSTRASRDSAGESELEPF